MAQGFFLAIEGTDRSSSTKQFELLSQRLRDDGYDVLAVTFPRDTATASYLVRQYQQGAYGSPDEVGPYVSALLYAMDRYDIARHIKRAVEAGQVVLAHNYTGATMADLATLLRNPAERHGFYVWLETLEFNTLRIPRPSASLVLRSSEADQRTTAIYDEICSLFPRDFVRFDCVQNGELQTNEVIHEQIWQSIKDLLPAEKVKGEPLPSEEPTTTVTRSTEPQLIFDGISTLAQSYLLADPQLRLETVLADVKQGYVTPGNVPADIKETYSQTMDEIIALYKAMVPILTKYLISQSTGKKLSQTKAKHQAKRILAAVLPLAVKGAVSVNNTDAERLQSLQAQLRHEPLKEVQRIAERLSPSTYEPLHHNDHEASVEMYADQPRPVTLVNRWPRNEMDTLPDLIYRHSSASYRDLEIQLNNWSYEQKLDALEAHITNHGQENLPKPAFAMARYEFDLVSDFETFRAVQAQVAVPVGAWQLLTPRFGYAVPEVIEAADLTDDYLECFDKSLELHSLLQQAGHPYEAQYAVLAGHRVRWKLSVNLNDIAQLYRYIAPSAAYTELVEELYAEVSRAHPILAEAAVPID